MANELISYVGTFTRFVGISTTAYGIISSDMETIVGGIGLGYLGNQICRDCLDADIEVSRQKTLEKRIKGEEI